MEYNGKDFMERLRKYAVTDGGKQKTNKEISEDIHVSEPTVSRWTKTIPRTENLIALADKYGCTIDYLLGRENYHKIVFMDVIRELLYISATEQTLEHPFYDFETKISFDTKETNSTCSAILQIIDDCGIYYNIVQRFNDNKKALSYIQDNKLKKQFINNIIDSVLEDCQSTIDTYVDLMLGK